MIEVIQDLMWDIGGFTFTFVFFIATIVWVVSWILNRVTGWHDKQTRENLIYWIRHKNELNKLINEKRKRG